ncbi:Nitrilase and fragile histidine triad fusion protein NitFhit [Lucilia cuprina]|uniref:Nitrilase and fragile histidine triad fusion protein NitFhit n=1 Tax=Lucilia cuprina TaxID=7375 RepID=A0A0L0CDX4_LUCCU|nr:nitrilase and fragile histidine triad fusion protein NitFhit [Lucilia cuprina]KAI8123307.1 Nitrilase and fragile histidine triad fusion protein NitFhit [Lucilia cuprina]KNC30613.1 Nitrilase and fragile histidine triad fusion protein NitFhit [Lucilia cuprina]
MLIQSYSISSIVRGNKHCKFFLSSLIKLRKMSSHTTESSEKTLVAITQMRSTNDKAANLHQVEKLIKQAKEQSAKFVFLPECCDFVGEHREQTLELSEPLTGPLMQHYQTLAKEHNIWLSLGGIHESVLDSYERKTDKIYNAHVILNNNGELVTVYRKLHLFDVVTPEFTFQESKVVLPGQRLVPPLTTPVGKLGLQICYDMRFAESSILLRKQGAEILTYPSAFAYNTGKAHWEVLLRARAIENQCFVLAPAQLGYHNKKRRSWGHGMAVNPWGKIMADLGETEDLKVATVEIDLSTLPPIRAAMPCFDHRRNDVYSLTAYGHGTTEPQEDRMFATNVINKDTIFFESPYCFAFTNLRCVVKGHVLVSTKRLAARLSSLNSAEMSDLFNTVCRIQRMLESIYETTAATVTVQDGADAGQTVPHVHFHVMPRRPGDFRHNDQIYVKLEDQVLIEDQKLRTLEERVQEAQKYREVMRSFKF